MPEAQGRVKGRTVLALALAAFLGSCTGGLVPPAVEPLRWSDCGGGFECGALGELRVLRRPAGDPAARIGVLVTNPGGPGISAVDHLRGRADDFPDEVKRRFDLVAFDTRRAGRCPDSLAALFALDPTPESDADWQAAVDAARALGACAQADAATFARLGTDANARDLERLRIALGEERISYLGFSDGTALGAVYASLYPEHVRALVLDAPVDPRFDLIAFAREQSAAVEGAFASYQREAAKRGWNGADVLEAVSARAERTPIPSGGGGRAARASDVLYGSVEGVVEPASWPALSHALGQARRGDGAALVRLSDRYFGRANGGVPALAVEEQLGVLCADLRRPPSLEAFRAALPDIAATSPHFGVANYLSLLPCMFWPEPERAPDPIRTVEGPAMLIVTSSGDPLTPPVWGERMAAALGAQRLDVTSDVHTSYGRADAAIAARIDAVLLEAATPAPAPPRAEPPPSR
jgi:pimeloyl-ACP methyl ester carboxylesterase